ncbi:hypothetical protein [Streptomyces sp. NPDC006631]|uniref:hypothetical protein n=1 Tax=Streptomyces sp. NPDC006631 TaxID=3364752 RepID=UPI00368834BC
MADITITIPEDYWPRVAAAFHGIYTDSTLGDEELLEYAFTAYVRDNWITWEENLNQNAGAPLYNDAARQYSTVRQQIDAGIQEKNEALLDDAATAFPGF